MQLNVVLKTRQGRTRTKTNSAWRRRTKTKSNVDGQGGERPRQRLAGAAVLGSLLLVGSDYVGDVGEGVFSLLEMLRFNYNRSQQEVHLFNEILCGG